MKELLKPTDKVVKIKDKLVEYSKLDNHADIEAKGLWDSVKTVEDIWCLCSVVEDPETKEDVVLLFHDYPEYDNAKVWDEDDQKEYTIPERTGSLLEGFRYWYRIYMNKGKLFVHNSMGYDKPIVEKVMPKCVIPTNVWQDTFVESKVQWFERPNIKGAKSPHGLKAYGIKLGVKKPDITDWTTMDKYKLHRVIEDVKIQRNTSHFLKSERSKLLELGMDFTKAITMEKEYALTCQVQEVVGVKVDVEHIKRCIIFLDNKTKELAKGIEPILPMTCKKPSGKVSKLELAELFGYNTNGLKEKYEMVNRNGESIKAVIKPYYKPSINFHVIEKTNNYSGFHISYGESPTYIKKNDLIKWIKNNYPDTKSKEWNIEKEIVETKLLNKNACEYFDVNPEDVDIISGAHTRIKWETSRMTQHEVVKGYLIKQGIAWAEVWNLKKDSDKQIIKSDKDMIIGYPPNAHPDNQMHYKVNKGDALVTSPKFGDKEYEQLETDDGQKVAKYNTYVHRRRFLSNPKDPDEKGILANVREDGRIPAGVNNFATATGRSSHKIWVNAPSGGALYGEEIRRTLITPEGRKFVSVDQNSAQLSIAGYYANNYEYFKSVCFGNEFKTDDEGVEILHPDTGKPWYIGESGHCFNARAFTLISNEDWKKAVATQDEKLIHTLGLKRKKSKGGSFATIFGASGKKVGLTLGIPEELGQQKKMSFLETIGLDRPIEICKAMTKKYKRGRGGYIELPFGYFVHCSADHKLFNYLDQGTEAACQKWAELYFDRESKRLGLDCNRVLSYHDEYTVECADDITEEVGKLMAKSYTEASIALWEWHKEHSKWFVGNDLPSFHINLASGYKVGDSYWDVH